MIYDEYGRPFIVIRDQEQKERIKGVDAIKVDDAPRDEILVINLMIEQYIGSKNRIVAFANFFGTQR